jgi:hypothetical protein
MSDHEWDQVCEPEQDEPVHDEPAPAISDAPSPAHVDKLVQKTGTPPPGMLGEQSPLLSHPAKASPLHFVWGSELSFDGEVGKHRVQAAALFNDDDKPYHLPSVQVTGSEAFRIEQRPTIVAPHSVAMIEISFTAARAVTERGKLRVETPDGQTASLSLIGTGREKAKPKASSSPPSRLVEPAIAKPKSLDNSKNTWRLAAPSKIELGDHLVGERADHTTSIFALDRQQGPRVRAQVIGDPSIQLARAPLFLPGSQQPYDESRAFKLAHVPTKSGEVSAVLEIEILDAPSEVFRYAVSAGAHAVGEPTIAEQHKADEQRRTSQDEARREEERRREMDRLGKQRGTIENFVKEDERDFGHAYNAAVSALSIMRIKRDIGISAARDEVGEFIRKKPAPEQPSKLEHLAWLALDLASAAIAGGVAKGIEPAVTAIFSSVRTTGAGPSWNDPLEENTKVTTSPSKALVGAVTDAIKHIIKQSLKKGNDAPGDDLGPIDGTTGIPVGTSRDGMTFAKASSNPEATFFAIQRESLVDEESKRAKEDVQVIYDALWPEFRVRPGHAIAAMKAVATSLTSEHEQAVSTQSEASVRQWVRYIAETAGLERATRTFDEEHPLTNLDGLIDLEIEADHTQPGKPAKIVAGRLDGVKKDVVKRFRRQQLSNLHLPVRVHTTFGLPGMSLAVTRHANGDIAFAEDTTQKDRGRWLAAKAYAHGRGRDAIQGARILMEEEVLVHSLGDVPTHNDSAEPKNTRKP